MTDISDNLTRAARHLRSREDPASAQLLARVAGPYEARVDWDLGAGEDWAMVFVDGDLASRVYMQAPVVIVLRKFAAAVADSVRSMAEVVVIDDWDADELRASTEALDAAFPDRRLAEDLDVRAFSAGDLWFYTV